jgi:hypothetical protein
MPMATNIDFILKNGLQVTSNVKVGSYTSGEDRAPINGMIVSGDVGIGSAVPSHKLSVTGNIAMYGTSGVTGIRFADGTWQYSSASSSAVGTEGSIQFNDGNGNFAYSPALDWDVVNNRLGVGTTVAQGTLHVEGVTPAIFNTLNGSNYEINVGNTVVGTALGFSTYGYLKNLGGSEMLTWNQNGLGVKGISAINALDVSGGAVIGSGIAYAGSATAPSNGLLVQGAIGIGTTATSAKLDVFPSGNQVGFRIKNPNANAVDFVNFVDSADAAKFTVNSSGNVTVGGWNGSVVNANYGGTGQSSFSTGDMLYATSSTTALSKLAIGSTGNIMVVSGGSPSWGTLDLGSTSAVGASILPLLNGGTSASLSAVQGGVVYSTASAMAITAASATSGNVLLSGGTSAPSWGFSYTSSNLPNTIMSRGSSGESAVGALTVDGALNVTTGGANITGALMATGTATVNALVSNGAISGTTISGTDATVTSLQSSGTATVNALVSNGAISGTTATVTSLQSSGTATVNALVSNGAISGTTATVTSLQSSGTATVNALVSNGAISGTTISGTSATVTSLQSSGTATVNALVSNGAISGTTISGTDATVTSLQSSGTATVNALVSNGAISGTSATVTSLQSSGDVVVASLTSNTTINSAGTATVNALTSNTAITVSSGGVNVTGASQFTGNMSITGNLNVSGNINTVNSNVLVVQDPIIYVGENNPGNNWDLGIVGSYTDSTYKHTGMLHNHITGKWTFFDNLITEPGETINWSQPGLVYDDVKAGTLELVTTTASTNSTTGALTVAGGVGVSGNINAGQQIATQGGLNIAQTAIVNALVVNTSTQTNTLTVQTSALVNNLTSNGAISGTTINGTAGTFTSLQSSGTATVNALVSNGAISGTTVTGTDFNGSSATFSGTVTANAFVSNTALSASSLTVGTLTVQTSALVNNLTSNGAISGTTIDGTAGTFTSLQSSGTATVSALVSNGAISGTTISGTAATVTSLQSSGTATVSALVSNSSVSGNSFVVGGGFATTGGTSPLTMDSFPTATYRTMHYIAQVTDNSNVGDFQATQFMIIHDGSNAFKTEYNIMYTNGLLGNFDASVSGADVVVTFTATASTNKTVKLVRTGITV